MLVAKILLGVAALNLLFLAFEVALVELPHHTELATIVEIFERINRTGEPLGVKSS
jgi:hypothetical protein